MAAWLDHIVEQYGVLAVFAGTALEGETVAMTSGVLTHEGYMKYVPVVAAAFAGAFLSDFASYWFGRTYKDSQRVQKTLQNPTLARIVGRLSGNLVTFALIFRFIPGMKVAGAISLGTLGMRPGLFALCAGISAALWSLIFVSIGYLLGNTIELIFGDLKKIEHAIVAPALIGVTIGLGVWIWRRYWHRRETEGAG